MLDFCVQLTFRRMPVVQDHWFCFQFSFIFWIHFLVVHRVLFYVFFAIFSVNNFFFFCNMSQCDQSCCFLSLVTLLGSTSKYKLYEYEATEQVLAVEPVAWQNVFVKTFDISSGCWQKVDISDNIFVNRRSSCFLKSVNSCTHGCCLLIQTVSKFEQE